MGPTSDDVGVLFWDGRDHAFGGHIPVGVAARGRTHVNGCICVYLPPSGYTHVGAIFHTPGLTIGFNGLAGNLGVAVAALLTGFLVKWFDWRAAFAVPAIISFVCGGLFLLWCPVETEPPSKRTIKAKVQLPKRMLARALLVLTMAAVSGNLLYNFTTNGNGQLMIERFQGVIEDPAVLGTLLALVYAVAAVAQIVVGRLLDQFDVKPFFMAMAMVQIPLLVLVSLSSGWLLYASLLVTMMFVLGRYRLLMS